MPASVLEESAYGIAEKATGPRTLHRVTELLPARQPHRLRPIRVAILASNLRNLHEADEEWDTSGGLRPRRRPSLTEIHSGSEPAGFAPGVDTEVGHRGGLSCSGPLGTAQARGLRNPED